MKSVLLGALLLVALFSFAKTAIVPLLNTDTSVNSCATVDPYTKICLNSSTIGVCIGKGIFYQIPCGPKAKFCDDRAICSSTPPFYCPKADGVFPALIGCNYYYSCETWTSRRVICESPNFVYSPEKKSCVPSSSANPCHKFNCSGNRSSGSYSGDKSIYAICKDGTPLYMSQCDDGLTYDDLKQKCI